MSDTKFQRTYELVVRGKITEHIFTLPTTMNFDIHRDISSTPNAGTFTLFNIKPSVREDIHLYRYNLSDKRPMILRAGYLSQKVKPIIFRGDVNMAYSERRGVNVATVIKAIDGREGILNGYVSFSRQKGWSLTQMVQEIIRTMPGIKQGTIAPQNIENTRGVSFNGNSWNNLQRLALKNGSYVFIDKEVANFLTKDSTIVNGAGILEISPTTGLLNMPSLAGTTTLAQTIFEPNFDVGNLAKLISKSNPSVNGIYKINGFHHYGTISGVESGDAITEFNLITLNAPQI